MFRFLTGLSLCALSTSTALATEVLWFGEPSTADRVRVATLAVPEHFGFTSLDLMTAAYRASVRDAAAIEALLAAIEEVRPYETRLDGELVIMRNLQRPIDGVGLVRDSADRDALFKALTYQGFAVDRYFMDGLSTSDDAQPFTTQVAGVAVERPWVDAAAIEPMRDISPYEIAEAPQRVAYTQVRDEVARGLPATLVPTNLMDGAVFVVDGRDESLGATGSVRVPRGRHLAHVEVDNVVLQRWDLRLAAGEERELSVDLNRATVDQWLADLWAGADTPMPSALAPHVDALGGEVWLAKPTPRGVELIVVRATDVERRTLGPIGGETQQTPGFSGFAAAHAGWLSSGNFALDKSDAEFTRGEVNAFQIGATLGASYTQGLFRAGVGVQIAVTPGADHVARYGSNQLRARIYPYLAVGIRPAQITVGWTFPHHPTVGLRSEIRLVGDLELQATGWFGLPTTRERDFGGAYRSLPLYAATLGLGYRLGGRPDTQP